MAATDLEYIERTGRLHLNIDITQAFTSLPDGHHLGEEVYLPSGQTLVLIKAGAAIAAKEAVKIGTTNLTNVVKTAELVDPIFGIAPYAIASGSYGYVITKGYAVNAKLDTGTLKGDLLQSSTNDGRLKKYDPTVTAVLASLTLNEATPNTLNASTITVTDTGVLASTGRTIYALEDEAANIGDVYIF